MGKRPLDELTDEELFEEARRRGLVLGRSLHREQVLALLSERCSEEDDEEEDWEELVSFPTITMARLYAEQGHKGQAARLCRQILQGRPDNRQAVKLLARLAESRAEPERTSTLRHHVSGIAGRAASASQGLPERYGYPMLLLRSVKPSALYVAWEAPEALVLQTRASAGGDATLVLRLFSAWRGSRGVERRIEDTDVAECQGWRFLAPCAPDAMHRAALGWRTLGTFVPMVHSPAAATPSGRQSQLRRPLFVPVRCHASRRASESRLAARLIARFQEELSMELPWEGTEWPGLDGSADLPVTSEVEPTSPWSSYSRRSPNSEADTGG